ncbi:MAG TPA: peptide-methionine (S)-S-oxide reductase [Helicobacteraceae bacterium]|nr:peptide-methionine (S)-S-oxide reductase [Helicobacteraceae bacterium]
MANHEVAVFGGGCFWCTEAVFMRLRGVEKVVSAYAGGQTLNPTYQEICSGTTGHAEVVEITFDADVIAYKTLLEIFFATHNPTTLNQQGADRGTQYRSVIFYQDTAQKEIAASVMQEQAGNFSDPIVTELSEMPIVYPAEAYHQNYYNLNPSQGYCQMVIAPKVTKFMQAYADKL